MTITVLYIYIYIYIYIYVYIYKYIFIYDGVLDLQLLTFVTEGSILDATEVTHAKGKKSKTEHIVSGYS